MAYRRACSLDDLWEGEMAVLPVDGQDVLLVHAEGGIVRALDVHCPHQEVPLIDGLLEGKVLTCSAHLWQFDVETCEGVNPTGCRLKRFALRIEDNDVLVDLERVESA